jgi:hypothetical protein
MELNINLTSNASLILEQFIRNVDETGLNKTRIWQTIWWEKGI